MTDAYSFVEGVPPLLSEPTLVMMLTGWIDASGAAAAAMSMLEVECEASTIAVFDGDIFLDYRARRPIMQLREGVNSQLVWQDIEVKAGADSQGRDVLLLTGPEPDMAWRRFAAEVAALATDLGVRRVVGLGAYPFAIPHTRPARLSMTSPSAELIQSLPTLKNSVDVPAGVAAVIEHSCHDASIEVIGLWVQVPHYVASMPYPAATEGLLAALADIADVHIDSSVARQEAILQRQRLDELVAGNEDHGAMVRQLESLYDAAADSPGGHQPDGASLIDTRIPTADELGAEFEQFLRDQGDST